jgi:hypothetical protein
VISREGVQVATVNPTPGSIRVEKSSRSLDMSCTLENYEPGQTSIPASTDAMTAGNVLVGGVIGLAVDASTGAMNKYPPDVSLSLRRSVVETPRTARR